MKYFLLMIVVVALVGCASTPRVVPNNPEANAVFHFDPNDENHVKIEAAVREELSKPQGELTKVDWEKVTKLYLYGNQITDVSALAGLTQLKALNLNSNALTDDQLTLLAGLKQLKELNLKGNQITDVSALARLTQLKVLYLGSNKFTDDQLKHLAGLTQLTSLDLTHNQLTDVRDLVEVAMLGELRLDNNQLTDLSPLAGLNQLKELTLYNNLNLTEAKIAKLQKALPKCTIYDNVEK